MMMESPFRHEAEVEKQLVAIETSHFDIRVVNPQGKVVEQRDELFIAQIKDILEWLHEKNQKGNRIEVRPSGEHGISLVSGLDHKQVQTGRLKGYEPALVVEYAKDRFQIWLKHDRKLSAEEGVRATELLCQQLEGDPDHSRWGSFGYLAGFIGPDRAAKFRVTLTSHSGEVFSEAKALNDNLG